MAQRICRVVEPPIACRLGLAKQIWRAYKPRRATRRGIAPLACMWWRKPNQCVSGDATSYWLQACLDRNILSGDRFKSAEFQTYSQNIEVTEWHSARDRWKVSSIVEICYILCQILVIGLERCSIDRCSVTRCSSSSLANTPPPLLGKLNMYYMVIFHRREVRHISNAVI